MSKNEYASFTWTINNIIYCWQKNDEALASPMFSIYMPEETKWQLLLFPRGVSSDKDSMYIYLYRDKDCKGGEIIEVEYDLEIQKIDGHSWVEVSENTEFHKGKRKGFNTHANTIERKLWRNIQRGILVIVCKVFEIDRKAVKKLHINARTIIGVEKRLMQWPIEISNLAPAQTQSYVITSESREVIMQINLFLTSDNEENVCFSIYSFDRRIKFCAVKTVIIDFQKQEFDSGEFQCWFNCEELYPLTVTKKTLLKYKDIYLPNDILTLSFQLAVSTGIAFEGIEKTVSVCTPQLIPNKVAENWKNCIAHKKDDCPCELIMELSFLYRDQHLSDMKLKTKTNDFPVHTAILGARSSVFRAMFSSDMKEKINGCVNVSDFTDETVHKFLQYLYTDQLEDLKWDDAMQLYEAADKYAVISLRDKCSAFLKSRLNVDNACEVLVLSDSHQDKDLKEMAQNFILKNGKVIFKSGEWKVLAHANSKLAVETMLRNWNDE